jgi:hypothetical protein
MADVPVPTRDILTRLEQGWSCRRCKCRSCYNGYENHEHGCTDGPDCVETRERLRARCIIDSIVARAAADEIKALRRQVAEMTARNAMGDGI